MVSERHKCRAVTDGWAMTFPPLLTCGSAGFGLIVVSYSLKILHTITFFFFFKCILTTSGGVWGLLMDAQCLGAGALL